ncbi:ATP-dependent DNA helicase [Trichonephila clavipes]|nr:ATP-dependent DNA helicase [Trichonephila clavipes]
MSASARARASQKYKSRLSLERGGYGPHTGTPMSGAERARRFRERRKADAARNFSAAANLASTSNTGIPVLMDVTNEQTAANLASTSTSGIPLYFVRNVLGLDGTENNGDFENAVNTIGISAVPKRSNVMSKQEYCHMMRSTNNGQRELILETIHRLHLSDSIPIQIFFTGPAGSALLTYVLKLLMETYNRYTQQHNSLRNAFVACASTGKAAINLGGVTVHSAFKITQSRRIGTMAREVLQNYRSTFIGVKCIIIDEVSMIGCDVLHKINLRLQEITVYMTNRLAILTSSSAEIFISYRP